MGSTTALAFVIGAPLLGAAVLTVGPLASRPWIRTGLSLGAVIATAFGVVWLIATCGVLANADRIGLSLGILGPDTAVGGAAWALAPIAFGALFIALGVREGSRGIVVAASVGVALSVVSAALDRAGASAGPAASPLPGGAPALILDPLSAALLLVSAGIGGIIVAYATGYEPSHLAHVGLPARRSGAFLAWLLVFLASMHLLVLADDLRSLVVGWEATTLCSFSLIRFDGTADARAAATRALLYNAAGGAALALAVLVAGPGGTLSGILAAGAAAGAVGGASGAWVAIALGGCIAAAAVKSALVPFHPWLLGAMVASAPVSALLHASTMVKAGSYLLLRLAPAIARDGLLGPAVTLLGGLSFAIAALLALRERDLKRILALSTVSGLGLIAASAGLGSAAALAAGTMLLVFHAAAKALAFLAVGSIEQAAASRDVEVLAGVARRMPRLAAPLLAAVAALALPPFGIAAAKWAILEVSAREALLTLLLAIGAAANVALWTAVCGRLLMRRDAAAAVPAAPIAAIQRGVAELLAIACMVGLVLAAPVARWLADPAAAATFGSSPGLAGGWSILLPSGGFTVPLLAVLLVAALVAGWVVATRVRLVAPAPYLSGASLRPRLGVIARASPSGGPTSPSGGAAAAVGSASGAPLLSQSAFHGPLGVPVTARSGGFHWGADVRPRGHRPRDRMLTPEFLGWTAVGVLAGATVLSALAWIATGRPIG